MSAGGLAIDEAAWSSPWRTRAVRDKTVLCLGLVGSALVLPPWPGTLVVAGTAAAVLLGPARVPPALLLRVIRWPAAFLLCGVLSVLVSLGWDGRPTLSVTAATAGTAAALLGHGLAGLLAVLVLAATTPMVDLLDGLRRARVPAVCVDIAQLTYRLLFVFLGTARQIREAQEARLGYAGARAALASAATLTGTILVRSWDRAARLEAGLAGRGYIDDLTTLAPDRRASTAFLLASVGGVAAICIATLLCARLTTGTLP